MRQGSFMLCFTVLSPSDAVRNICPSLTSSTLRTFDTLGIPRYSATSAPTCAVSPSVVCLPHIKERVNVTLEGCIDMRTNDTAFGHTCNGTGQKHCTTARIRTAFFKQRFLLRLLLFNALCLLFDFFIYFIQMCLQNKRQTLPFHPRYY